jgi:hypothetical protein
MVYFVAMEQESGERDDIYQQLRLSLEGLQSDTRFLSEQVKRLNQKLDDWRAQIVRDRAEWRETLAQSFPRWYRRMRFDDVPSALARSVRKSQRLKILAHSTGASAGPRFRRKWPFGLAYLQGMSRSGFKSVHSL